MEKASSRPQSSARKQMMDYLARREHSEEELRRKLKSKEFTDEEIEKAISHGREKGWIPASTDEAQALSLKTASDLRRKGKGSLFINHYLEERGLPPVPVDSEVELEKAQALAHNKFSNMKSMNQSEKAKVGRFLISRGFDIEIVRKVIND